MADSKITALASIGTGTDPANDPLVIVDVSDVSPGGMSATGTTKKVTLNNLLACSPTATLASATISGDLTVDTNVLKVDTANNRVGIGTASPANTLEVVAPAGDNIVSTFRSGDATAANNAGGGFRSISSATAASRVAQIWLDADGANFSGGDYFYIQKNGNSGTVEFNQSSNAAMTFLTNSTERARIDSSGNLGIGVTPSAWSSGYKAIQVGTVGSLSSGSSSTFGAILASNVYQAAGGNAFIGNGYATRYDVRTDTGSHVWYTSNNNTLGAGQIVSFTPAMTLDASGNWIVGGTSQISSCRASITNTGGDQLAINATNTSTGQSAIKFCNAGTAQAFIWWDKSDSRLYVQNSSGGVYLASTATSWTANSDERLKDIIEPISNAVAKVGSLRSVIGKFKTDSNGTRRSFLIAQDVQSVLPEAVDASNPDRLGVAYSDVIPLLVAAIKELTARVQTLEAK